jgi:hypothetical protein
VVRLSAKPVSRWWRVMLRGGVSEGWLGDLMRQIEALDGKRMVQHRGMIAPGCETAHQFVRGAAAVRADQPEGQVISSGFPSGSWK